jgi:hypothetical protein
VLLLLAERIVGRRGDVLAVRRVWGRAEHRLRREVRENVRCTDGAHERQERPAPFCRPLLATRHSNQDDRPCPLAFYPRGPGLAAFAQAEEIASLYCDKKGSPTELAIPHKVGKLSSSAQRVCTACERVGVVKRVCTGYPVAHRARATAPRHWTPLPARPLCSARRPASSARARVQRGAGAAVGQELCHDPACASRAL